MKNPPDLAKRFDAFISYSHRADSHIATALEYEIQRFAKPWFRLRSAKVFRDETNLSVSPHLWSSITAHLNDSAYLIFIASTESAGSKWVQKELTYWLTGGACDDPQQFDISQVQQNQAERLFLVLTDGEIVWDDELNDFDWDRTVSLPKVLSGVFDGEPLWVDLRWAREQSAALSRKNESFMKTIAKLSAPIRGLDIHALIGKDYAEHRRTLRHVWYVSAVLAIFLIVAIWQMIKAQTNESRSLASLSRIEVDRGDPIPGALLALRGLPDGSWRPLIDEAVWALQTALQTYAVNRFVWPFKGHGGQRQAMSAADRNQSINGLAFSPNGSQLLTASADASARILDVKTGHECAAVRHRFDVLAATFSPDGRFIVTGSKDGEASLWDTKGNRIAGFKHWLANDSDLDPINILHEVHSIDVSPDSKFVVTGSIDGVARIWDVASEKKLFSLSHEHKGVVSLVKYNKTGDYILTRILTRAGDDEWVVWRAADRTAWLRFGSEDDPVISAEFGPTGQHVLVASKKGVIRILDLATKKPESEFRIPEGRLGLATYDAAGDPLAVVSSGGAIEFWDVEAQRRDFSFPLDGLGQGAQVTAFAVGPAVPGGGLPRGQLLIAFFSHASGPVGVLLDRRTGSPLTGLRRGDGAVVSAAFSGDGKRLALGTSAGEVTLWDTSFADLGGVLRGHAGPVVSVRAYPGDANRIVTAADDGSARVWDVAREQEVVKIDAKAGPLADAVISPDGRLLLTRSRLPAEPDVQGPVRLWNAGDGSLVSQLHGDASVLFADFDGTGQRLVTGLRDGSVWVWDTASGTNPEKKKLFDAQARTRYAAFAGRDRYLLTAHGDPMLNRDNSVHVFDLETSKDVFRLLGHELPVNRVEARDDIGRVITCSWDGSVRLWNLGKIEEDIRAGKEFAQSGDELAQIVVGSPRTPSTMSGEMEVITLDPAKVFATFSHDGKRFVAAGDIAGVWDSSTGELITELQGHTGKVLHAAFSKDDRRVATGGDDATVRVWNARSGALIFTFRGHLKAVNGVLFLDDDRRLASASADGTIRTWDLAPDWRALVNETQLIIPRQELTPAELQRAFLTPTEASSKNDQCPSERLGATDVPSGG